MVDKNVGLDCLAGPIVLNPNHSDNLIARPLSGNSNCVW